MRTTKFRGKQIVTGRWLEGSLLRRGNRCFIVPFESEPRAKETEVDPKTVGQFTGHLDWNGKEVWEGDAVLAAMLDGLREILVIGWGDRGFTTIDEEGYDYADWFPVIEVVGNIHDNPDIMQNNRYQAGNDDIQRCEECGSKAMQQRAWVDINSMKIEGLDNCSRNDYYCKNCDGNHYPVSESDLLKKANEWWGGTDFKDMERITRYRQLDFDPEDGYQAFVDACDEWWNGNTTDKKINTYIKTL